MIPLVVDCTIAESSQRYNVTVSEQTVCVDAEILIPHQFVVDCTVEESQQQYNMTIAESYQSVNADISVEIVAGSESPPYQGEYVHTPRSETITIPCAEYRMLDNITINPIPSNYGLITWDGRTITVS